MIRMSDNVLSFAEKTNTKLFERFADLWNHYRSINDRKEYSYEKNDSQGNTISFDEKNHKVNELLKTEIAKLAGITEFGIISPESWVSHPSYRWATFAVVGALIDMVIPDTIIDSIGAYTDVRNGGFGDNFSFDIEPNDLFYVSKSGRGVKHAEAQKSFNGQVIVTPVEHDVSVIVNLYRVLAGKENLAAFAMKCVRSIETEMAYDVYSAFDTAMAAVPSTASYNLYYTGYSQSNFIELTDKVQAYNNGAKPIVLGTRQAVNKIIPAGTAYRPEIDSEYVKIGFLPQFCGIDIIVLPQKANWKTPYASVLDDTRLYVISPASQKIVKLCIEGSTLSITDDPYANANLTQQTTLKKSWGTGLATNATYGMIEIS